MGKTKKSFIKNVIDFSTFDMADYNDVEGLKELLGVCSKRELYHKFLKKADNYLIYLRNCKWNGASGYKVVDNIECIFDRGYDCSINLLSVSGGKKFVKCREAHHDVPTGHYSYIVALTKSEYSKLNCIGKNCSVFDYIEKLISKSGIK